MSLKIYPKLEQRSEEWLAARRGMVTASVVQQLVTPANRQTANNDYSRALTAELVAERITGYSELNYVTADMWRGIESEPLAVACYSEHYAPVTTCGFMVRNDWGFSIGYSPDGLVGNDGLIEVKAPRAKYHVQTILADEVPAQHIAQIQCGLLVSGRDWCDFISYSAGLPMWHKRVLPDPAWHKAIVTAVNAFEIAAEQMVSHFAKVTKDLPATERVELELVI